MRTGAAAVTLLAGLLLAPGGFADDYRQSYLDGVRAARRGDWEQVVRRMREAIATDGVEKERARLVGAIPDPYLPHYYLGKAFYETHDCVAARSEWKVSLRQGAIQSQEELLRELRRGDDHCQDLEQATAALERAAKLEAKADETALAQLTQARQSLAASRESWTPAAAADAAKRAVDAAARLEALAAEIARREPVQPEPVVPVPPPPVETLPPESSAEPPPPEPSSLEPSPPPPPAPVPDWLVDAAQAYFDGDYERTLDLVADPPEDGTRAAFYARLFQAAARHALYLLDGERDASLLAAVTRDLGECRRQDPAFRPPADYFPPSLVALYESAKPNDRR